MYDACRDDDNGTTRAIVGYLLVYQRQEHPESASADVQLADSLLQRIQNEKPGLVKAVKWELEGPTQRSGTQLSIDAG